MGWFSMCICVYALITRYINKFVFILRSLLPTFYFSGAYHLDTLAQKCSIIQYNLTLSSRACCAWPCSSYWCGQLQLQRQVWNLRKELNLHHYPRKLIHCRFICGRNKMFVRPILIQFSLCGHHRPQGIWFIFEQSDSI